MSSPGEQTAPPLSAALQCIWEVTAGIIPGEVIPDYTRRFPVSSQPGTQEFHDEFLTAQGTAMAYAISIQNPRSVNWVRLDWLWT